MYIKQQTKDVESNPRSDYKKLSNAKVYNNMRCDVLLSFVYFSFFYAHRQCFNLLFKFQKPGIALSLPLAQFFFLLHKTFSVCIYKVYVFIPCYD